CAMYTTRTSCHLVHAGDRTISKQPVFGKRYISDPGRGPSSESNSRAVPSSPRLGGVELWSTVRRQLDLRHGFPERVPCRVDTHGIARRHYSAGARSLLEGLRWNGEEQNPLEAVDIFATGFTSAWPID